MSPAHQREEHSHPDATARIEEILDLLRADGGRVTTRRRAVVRALLTGPDHHVTADDLTGMVQAEHPDIHLSTVYRTLDALERLRVVDRVNLGSSGAVYHLTDHAHHHLVCDGCGRVIEVAEAQLATLADELRAAHGFDVSARHLAIHGRCSECQADAASSSAPT